MILEEFSMALTLLPYWRTVHCPWILTKMADRFCLAVDSVKTPLIPEYMAGIPAGNLASRLCQMDDYIVFINSNLQL